MSGTLMAWISAVFLFLQVLFGVNWVCMMNAQPRRQLWWPVSAFATNAVLYFIFLALYVGSKAY